MIHLVVCDLDETLLDQNRHVSMADRKAIAAFEQRGGYFVPCTGRIYTCLKPVLRELDAWAKPDHYVISVNGGIISENAGGIVYAHALDHAKVEALSAYAQDKGIAVELFCEDGTVLYRGLTWEERAGLLAIVPDARPFADLREHAHRRFVKVMYERNDMDYLLAFAQEMPASLKEGTALSFSSGRYIELNPCGVSKGEGLRQLAKRLGIPLCETMAIGDHFNDMEMLRAAGVSVAVNNALDEVKAICDYVCKRSCNESAVAEALAAFQ